jgi:hypothetical protein
MFKKVILAVLVILVLGSTVLLAGCYSPVGCYSPQSYYPIDGKVTNLEIKTTNAVYVLAQEFVTRQDGTHTILYLSERDNSSLRYQIEVNNKIIFNSTDRTGWWLFEFTPTEEPNVYTITKMSY